MLRSKVVCNAGIAQLVERNFAKVKVASSRLVSRSINAPMTELVYVHALEA